MTLQIPHDAEAKAAKFPRLSMETKRQLINTLKDKPVEDQTKILSAILRQSGTASDFYKHLLGKEFDDRVPHNKRVNPIHTK